MFFVVGFDSEGLNTVEFFEIPDFYEPGIVQRDEMRTSFDVFDLDKGEIVTSDLENGIS